MANQLTGDFDAVIQISGGTVNRLHASMHQNAFADPQRPSFPHSVALRIGDELPLDGVRGSVRAQTGCPRISLLDGVTDRFRLEVAIRARYKADPGSTPLAEFIEGTVSAEYRLTAIDPNCPGWRNRANDHLWIRVVKESVRFEGSARSSGPASIPDADLIPRITRQIAHLLSWRFTASPHPVDRRFRKGAIRTLAAGGESAMCMAVPVVNAPFGDIASVNRLFIGGADIALAISSDTVLGLAQPAVSAIAAQRPSFQVTIGLVTTVYNASIPPPAIQWLAFGSHGVLRMTATATAKTNSILPDFIFDISQDIVISFDAGSERLELSVGGYSIRATSSYPIPRAILDSASAAVTSSLRASVTAAVAASQPFVNAITSRSEELTGQLRTFDGQAGMRYGSAEFLADGIILRGSVYLAPRRAPVAAFGNMADADGYTAYDSWIPGGQVDRFLWSWTFDSGGSAQQDSISFRDRFVLQRPVISAKWGGGRPGQSATEAVRPLPGLDGPGRICVEISGSHADPDSGALVPAVVRSSCRRFGLPILTAPGLLWRVYGHQSRGEGRTAEAAVMDVSALGGPAANTLLLSIGQEWDREHEITLIESLAGATPNRAGLAVVVLFPDERMGEGSRDLLERVEALAERLEAPVLVNENVMDSWSGPFLLPRGQDAWRLIGPGGGITWMRDGRLMPSELTDALNHGLFESGPPLPAVASAWIQPGALFPVTALDPNLSGLREDRCPPVPKGRFGLRETIVGFVMNGTAASTAKLAGLHEMASRAGDSGPTVFAVVSGANEQASGCGVAGTKGAIVLEDPDGTLARQLGVSMWPTTLTLNAQDVIVKAEFGLEGGAN